VNSIWIGVQTHVNMQHNMQKVGYNSDSMIFPNNENTRATFKAVDRFFLVLFFVELMLRICAERLRFFLGHNARWNFFYAFLVLLEFIEIMIQVGNVKLARLLRVVRMVRVLRIVRTITFFRSLRQMVLSVMNCLLALFWLSLLMLVVIYVFAVAFMQACVENLFVPGKMQRETIQSMQPVFGTLYSSMLSLFMAISGGDDWRNVMEPIAKVSFWTQFAFVFYIIFMVFGVLNVVTGVFVDKALAISQIDQEFTILEKVEQKKSMFMS